MTKKKDPAKLARKRIKKEQALLEAQIKQSTEKTLEAKTILETPIIIKSSTINFQKALDILQEAITLNPDNDTAYTLIGDALRTLGKIEESVNNYTTAFKLNPINIAALEGRASCFEHLKQWKLAVEDYTKIIAIQPNNDHAYNLRGVFRLKERPMGLLMKRSDFESILSDFLTALKFNENNYFAHCNLGKAYADQRIYDKAIEHYILALGIKENYPYALYRCACACVALATVKLEEEERLTAELRSVHEIIDEARSRIGSSKNIKNNNNNNNNSKPGISITSHMSTPSPLSTKTPLLPPIFNKIPTPQDILISTEEQVIKENALAKVKHARKTLLMNAITYFNKIINPDNKSEEISAVIHIGMCYYDIGDYQRAKKELSFALSFIHEKQQERLNDGKSLFCSDDTTTTTIGGPTGTFTNISFSNNNNNINNNNNVNFNISPRVSINPTTSTPLVLGSSIIQAPFGDLWLMERAVESKLRALEGKVTDDIIDMDDDSLLKTTTDSLGLLETTTRLSVVS